MMGVKSVLKWHGGKAYLAKWIISHFPEHEHYVEPYAGGLSVLLQKKHEGVSEVVNDLNGNLMRFWKVLQDEEQFERLLKRLQITPFSEEGWEEVSEFINDPEGAQDDVDVAHAIFVQCRQSLAGRMKAFAAISKTRLRQGKNEQVAAWRTAVDGLPEVHDRLLDVLMLNRDALSVIREFDNPKTVIYCDPPYLQDTRTAKKVYEHEMPYEQHEQLLDTVLNVQHAFVAISCYDSELYQQKLKGWRKVQKDIANHAAGGKEKKRMVETLYLNQ